MAIPLIGIDLGGAYAGAVHQDRLVLLGSSAISDLVMASRIGGERTDFRVASTDRTPARAAASPVPERLAYAGGDPIVDPENPPKDENDDPRPFTATPADGFWFQQTSSRSNTFHAAIQQQGLFIFGDIGEANVPGGPFTAQEVVIRENSWYGTEIGRTVLIVGGLVTFIQKGGKDVRGVNWSEQDRKYVAPSLLVLSGNLFDRAVDMSFAPSRDRRSDTIYIVGESAHPELDGQLATMLLRHQEPFYAWSRWHTEGRVIGGASPLGSRCFLVERGGNPLEGMDGVVALETLDEDDTDNLDAAVVVPALPVNTPEGLPYTAYGDLPASAAWMEGLTDLDGLEFWHIRRGDPLDAGDDGTLAITNRGEILARREDLPRSGAAAVLSEGPDDAMGNPTEVVSVVQMEEEPVLRVIGPKVQERSTMRDGANQVVMREVDVRDGDVARKETVPVVTWVDAPVPDQDVQVRLSGRLEGVVGLRYTRMVDTLPFVARKQTGTSTRVRPARVMEVNVDFILPTGMMLPESRVRRGRRSQTLLELDARIREQMLRLGQVSVSLVAVNRGRGRVRDIRRSPRVTHLDTPRIVRLRYGGRAGYRDRLALRVESSRHVVMAGLAYRAVS